MVPGNLKIQFFAPRKFTKPKSSEAYISTLESRLSSLPRVIISGSILNEVRSRNRGPDGFFRTGPFQPYTCPVTNLFAVGLHQQG